MWGECGGKFKHTTLDKTEDLDRASPVQSGHNEKNQDCNRANRNSKEKENEGNKTQGRMVGKITDV